MNSKDKLNMKFYKKSIYCLTINTYIVNSFFILKKSKLICKVELFSILVKKVMFKKNEVKSNT